MARLDDINPHETLAITERRLMNKTKSLSIRENTHTNFEKAHHEYNQVRPFKERLKWQPWLEAVSLGKITIPKK